ncbi:MAG: M20 family metallo-hydrolase [Treponemataceae bacterium]
MTENKKLFDFVDQSKAKILELQSLLTAIPALAPESNGNGELKKCEALIQWLKKEGFSNFERLDAPDSRVESGVRPNLIVTIEGKNPSKRLWVMSHLDIVPEGDVSLWQTNPFEAVEKDGKIFGRGVEDNQQGLVSSVFTALSFIKNNEVPNYTIKLLFVADEEVGSVYGIQYLLEKYDLFKKDDLIVVPDSGCPQGNEIEIAEKNLLWLKIETKGKQAHGSRPDEGINAHLANCELALLLHKLEKDFDKRDDLFSPNRSTFQPTKKETNIPNINTIPADDIFYMDCRILPCYSLDIVRKEIKNRKEIIEEKYSVKVSIEELQAVESPATPESAQVVKKLSDAIRRVYEIEPKVIGVGGGTVAGVLRQAGFHAVVWATLNETAHQPNEYCEIKNLINDAKILISLAIND